jgi:hypothetical protein
MFQEIRHLKRPVKIYPGDMLIHSCVYDTSDRSNMTFGGYSIYDEMCVNYMHYYPAVKLELCKSSISEIELSKFFKKYSEIEPTSSSVSANFNSIDWNPLMVEKLKTLYDSSPISFSCNSSDGVHIYEAYRRHDLLKNLPLTCNNKKFYEMPKNISKLNLEKVYAPLDKEFSQKCLQK